jgi:outer membrane protein OmpA-like peptidoglycan-associated protein
LLVDKQGQFPQLAIINSLLPTNEETAAQELAVPLTESNANTESQAPSPPAMPITIHQISVLPDVSVLFDDKSVRPEFNEEIRVQKFIVENIVVNSAEELAQVDLLVNLSHDADVSFAGQFNISSQLLNADLKINKFQLLSVSGYAKNTIGYALESGRFSLDSTIKIADDQLNTNNNILIDRLSLRVVEADKSAQFSKQLSMPLDQALDLLRDGDNKIKLRVPIVGAVNDPNIDIQQVINKALGSAMAKTSMLVLKSVLQPYGAIITNAQYAGEQATKVRLDSIEFDDGVATLNSIGKDYAAKVASLINKRESLTVKLCGVTDDDDLKALRAPNDLATAELGADASDKDKHTALMDLYTVPLANLAKERAKNLKEYLLQEQSVSADQLVMCLSKHSQESIVGGVELSI